VAAGLDVVTASVLAGFAGLHVAWGLGSAFPFASREELTDAVSGTATAPSPAASFAVAGALATGSLLVAGPPALPSRVRRSGLLAMSSVLALRAGLGWAGHTDKISPGSSSPAFRRLDRRVYSPICAGLATGALLAWRGARLP
jgi:Protein of unknown function (DUF3995)